MRAAVLVFLAAAAPAVLGQGCGDDLEGLALLMGEGTECVSGLCGADNTMNLCNKTCGLCPLCPFAAGSPPCKHMNCFDGNNDGLPDDAEACQPIVCSYCLGLYANTDAPNDAGCQHEEVQNNCEQVMCDSYALCDGNYDEFNQEYTPAVGKKCLNDCNGVGMCNEGECWCLYPHTGPDCSDILCHPSCRHGKCHMGECKCDVGWVGDTCNEMQCTSGGDLVDCGHGLCRNGTCECFEGYSGETCDETAPAAGYGCMVDCSSHGSCRRPHEDPTIALHQAIQAHNVTEQALARAEAHAANATGTLVNQTVANGAVAEAEAQQARSTLLLARAQRLMAIEDTRIKLVAAHLVVFEAEQAVLVANSSEALDAAESTLDDARDHQQDQWSDARDLSGEITSDLADQVDDKAAAIADQINAEALTAQASTELTLARISHSDDSTESTLERLQLAQAGVREAEEEFDTAQARAHAATHAVASTYAALDAAHDMAVQALGEEQRRAEQGKQAAGLVASHARAAYGERHALADAARAEQRTWDEQVAAGLDFARQAADAYDKVLRVEANEAAALLDMHVNEAELNMYSQMVADATTLLQETEVRAKANAAAMGEEIGIRPGECICDKGWTGADCSLVRCPKDCSNHGVCDGAVGNCSCYSGWSEADCSVPSCELCVNGVCTNGQCICQPGWVGPNCDVEECPNLCSSQGVCSGGECICEEGWIGRDCGLRECPRTHAGMCSNHGTCNNGTCECSYGRGGPACSQLLCGEEGDGHFGCQNGGVCDLTQGGCVCTEQWRGSQCEIKACPTKCSLRGSCTVNGTCICEDGFEGVRCERVSCPNGCSAHGQCIQPSGTCICTHEWMDVDCGKKKCPGLDDRCNGDHGECMDGGICACNENWKGLDCYTPRCPDDDCNGNGHCRLTDPLDIDSRHVCECKASYTGDQCENMVCDPTCKHGECDTSTGVCICEPSYYPPQTGCDKRECIRNCSFHGDCIEEEEGIFMCECHQGYHAYDCGSKRCPNSCSNHGVCLTTGTCVCEAGWVQDDCSERTCPSDCTGPTHGVCHDGTCMCFAGWEGQACDIKTCTPECWFGSCVNGECICQSDYEGGHCQHRKCPGNLPNSWLEHGRDCSAHGDCDRQSGTCECNTGWMDDDCGRQYCIQGCVNGDCIEGQCHCWEGFAGVSCEERLCPNDCMNHGRCDNGVCICDHSYDGMDCSIRRCYLDCSDMGTCTAENINASAVCDCVQDREGVGCERKICPDRCTSTMHGSCDYTTGVCTCNDFFGGSACELPLCELSCFGHGVCDPGSSGVCSCDEGWEGNGCNVKRCLSACHHHGTCNNGTCMCYEGYFGDTCHDKCLSNCTDVAHGSCTYDTSIGCHCTRKFYGADCSVLCPGGGCSGNGECQRDGTCHCDEGWAGSDCSLVADCPDDCSKRGACYDGMCTCDDGFSTYDYTGRKRKGGLDGIGAPIDFCRDRICIDDCNGNGACRDGVCECDAGWTEASCNVRTCQFNCHSHGYCDNGTCECFPGFTGEFCEMETCPNDCTGHGECLSGCCNCDDGWLGIDCSLMQCPQDCNNNGDCNYQNGACTCFSPYYGSACQNKLPTERVEEIMPDQEPEEVIIEDEQLRPSATFAVIGTLRFSIDLPDWSDHDNATVIKQLARVAEVPITSVEIIGLQQGSTILEYKIFPPEPTKTESAARTERMLATAFAGDFVSTLCVDGMRLCAAMGEDALATLKGNVDSVVETLGVTRQAVDVAESANEESQSRVVVVRNNYADSKDRATTLVANGDAAAAAVVSVVDGVDTLRLLVKRAKASAAMDTILANEDPDNVAAAVLSLQVLGPEGVKAARALQDMASATADKAAAEARNDRVTTDQAVAVLAMATAALDKAKIQLHVGEGNELPGYAEHNHGDGPSSGSNAVTAAREQVAVAMTALREEASSDPALELFLAYQTASLALFDAKMAASGTTPGSEAAAAVRAAEEALEVAKQDVHAAVATSDLSDGVSRVEAFVTLAAAAAGLQDAEEDKAMRGAVLAAARETAKRLEDELADSEQIYQEALYPMQVAATPQSVDADTAGSSKRRGCARCRNGREQVEHDDRLFTRRCGADGKCSKQVEMTIEGQCARGCNDHCLSSCRRFHDPKTKTCARARKSLSMKTAAAAAAALTPEESLLQVEEGGGAAESGMRGWIVSAIQTKSMAPVDVIESQLRAEVYVLADCYAECSRQCIEHCIGNWGNAAFPEQPDDYPQIEIDDDADSTNATNATNSTDE